MTKKYAKAKGRDSKKTFVMLRHDLMDSPAWHDLSCPARVVWTEIMRRYNGINNGKIPFSCREAALRCGISKGTAKKAFDELISHGFIKIAEFSNFTLKLKKSRRWEVTHEATEKNPPSNEWREWKNSLLKNKTRFI